MEPTPPLPPSSDSKIVIDYNSQISMKRKRTKRHQRAFFRPSTSSSSISSEEESPTMLSLEADEEEDMANCLILLAKGRSGSVLSKEQDVRAQLPPPPPPPATTSCLIYECKTCNKCFPTFQALGGHRASHKKPKIMASSIVIESFTEEKKMVDKEEISQPPRFQPPHFKSNFTTNIMNSNINNHSPSKPRIHECSICGSEFLSGQALGGHMRRHRSTMEPVEQAKDKKTTSLSFDLNLPAPIEEDRMDFVCSISFPIPQTPMLFSQSSTLVDCHY